MRAFLLLVISLCVCSIAGCGKAEITQKCSLSGGGETTCTYHNTGNAKGSTCHYLQLVADTSSFSRHFIQQNEGHMDIPEDAKEKLGALFAVGQEVINSELQKRMDIMGKMSTEICSGIVEAGDVRETKASVSFGKEQFSPADICKAPDYTWADLCGFIVVPKQNKEI